LRVGLACVAAPLLPAAPLALSTAASREVRSANCFSNATSRCSGADSTAAADGSGRADLTSTGLAGEAVFARRVEGTLAATGSPAGPAAVALRAATDVGAFSTVALFAVALFAVALCAGVVVGVAFVVEAVVAVVFSAVAVVAPAGILVALCFAGVAFLDATAADVRLEVAVAPAALTVLDVAGTDAFLATAFTDGPVPGPVCAAAYASRTFADRRPRSPVVNPLLRAQVRTVVTSAVVTGFFYQTGD